MNCCLIGHNFANEVQTMCQIFFPNEGFATIDESELANVNNLVSVKSEIAGGFCTTSLYLKGVVVERCKLEVCEFDELALRKAVKNCVYNVLVSHTGYVPPWGKFTGIRPSKNIADLRKSGFTDLQAFAFMTEEFNINADKINLSFEVANAEAHILSHNLSRNREKSFALYVGIPFCPTRCLYCSFTAFALDKYKGKVDAYLDCLIKEIEYMSKFGQGKYLETVYIGGGTPTSLNETQLERLLNAICANFNIKDALEFTIEAGRPDTITAEKLDVMRKFNVSRISINPQTMNEQTLRRIGRDHSPKQFLQAFEMARSKGFDNINVDIIVGLPEETLADVANTIEQICALTPESITVHTLSIKRASKLKEQLDTNILTIGAEVSNMLETVAKVAKAQDLNPYYMYRQKNMIGHFENVGYCKKGCESVYNIQMIGDAQTILGLGAGSVTKLYFPLENRLERVFNVKDVDEYIKRIDEMLLRKAVCFDLSY